MYSSSTNIIEPNTPEIQTPLNTTPEPIITEPDPPPPTPPPRVTRTSTRNSHPPPKFNDYHCKLPKPTIQTILHSKYHHSHYLNYHNLSPKLLHFINNIDKSIEPTTFNQASKHVKWVEAMNKEIEALEKNNTWELTTPQQGKKAIGNKWVFKIKHKADGNIERYKARLVVKGFNQKERIDYNETFAPVAKMVTLRTLLVVAIHHDWIIEQLDVNNEFLYGDLHEEWFEKLTTFLKTLGFKQSYVDTSLFTLQTATTSLSLLVYVDNILIARNDRSLINHLKTNLHTKFSIKDLGPLHYYLGIEFLRNKDGLALTQRKYALDLVTYVGLLDIKPSATPLDPNKKLTPDNAQALSQFLQQPRATRMKALLKVIRYVKLSMGQGLIFPARNNLHLTAYCDSDWASCPFRRRSVTGYEVFLGSCLISWQSKKQIVVSRSSTEAEYSALADTTCEVTWIQCLLKEFQVNVPAPIPMMCDNASSIALASNHVHHARSKHIEIDCHFVKDKVKAGQILPQYISTKNQLADILTKGLNRPLHYNCLTKLGMCNPYTLPTCEGDDKAEVIQGSKHPASVTNHSPKHSIQSLQSKRIGDQILVQHALESAMKGEYSRESELRLMSSWRNK
ncbi:RmlC-like cupins superfamily protein [Tanacetum coccineum]